MAVEILTPEQEQSRKLQALMLLEIVAQEFGVTADDVRGGGRKAPVVQARYVATFLLNLVEMLPEDMCSDVINRSQPTIISYGLKANDLLEADEEARTKALRAYTAYRANRIPV